MQAIKTIQRGATIITITATKTLEPRTINADGHEITGAPELYSALDIRVTRAGKYLGHSNLLRVLDPSNKFDAPQIAEGVVAKIDRIALSAEAAKLVRDAIAAAWAEATTPEIAAHEAAVAEARRHMDEINARVDTNERRVYAGMNSDADAV